MTPVQCLSTSFGLLLLLLGTSWAAAKKEDQGHWGSWSSPTPCSVTCGSGVREMVRTWIYGPDEAGEKKPFTGTKTFICINEDRRDCPRNGTWTGWSAWSDCTQGCGGGTRERQRKCIGRLYGGEACPGKSEAKEKCNREPCPPSITNGLRFEMRPAMFQTSNKNITLSCSISQSDDGPAIALLNKLQIKKMSLLGTWIHLATLKHDGSLDSSLGQAIATGYMGSVLRSYLNITWPFPSLQILGKYRCFSFGFTEEEKIKNENATIVVGGAAEPFPPGRRPGGAKGLEERLSNLISSSFSSFSSALDSRYEKLHSQKKCVAATPNSNTYKATEWWPNGTFALPMADSGCPLNPPAWDKGFKKMDAGNHHEKREQGLYSQPLHLQILKTKDGLVYQQFCSIQSSPARKMPWPAGSYCINYFKKSCPSGFHWSLFNPGHKSPKGGKMVSDKPENYQLYSSLGVAFCCRHDGDPHAPIVLPVSKPFYLYRHQGACQEVKDMEVTQDSLIVDTAINGNINFSALFPSQDTVHKPDFSVSPVKMELCYYSKPKQALDLDGVSNLTVFIRKEPQPQKYNLIHTDDQEVQTSTEEPQLDKRLPIVVENPGVPFSLSVDGLMVPGRTILVSGSPTDRTKRFNIFIADSDKHFLAMFVDFNLYLNNIVASYRDNGKWTHHKIVPINPFRQGQKFLIFISMEEDRFAISVGGKHVIDSMIRTDMKPSWLSHLYIENHVQLDLVKIY